MKFRSAVTWMWAVAMIVLVGAGTAQAESLNPQTARAAVVEKLRLKYGPEFIEASPVWVACPKEAVFDIDGTHAYCWGEFEKRRTRHFIVAKVDTDLTAEITDTAKWRREWRRCAGRYIRSYGIRGSLVTNDRRCATYSLIISDIDYYIREGRLKREFITGWHGTNTIGFGRVVRYVCKSKRHGSLYRIKCSNSLGDGFKLRLRY